MLLQSQNDAVGDDGGENHPFKRSAAGVKANFREMINIQTHKKHNELLTLTHSRLTQC